MVLIDLHCHLLPGVDDGSPDLATSLKLAQDAVNDGVTHALLTPHHMNGHYVNHKADVLQLTADFQQALNENEIPLTVFPGQEVRINGELLEALRKDDILFADEGGRYMLLEFPSQEVPQYAKEMVFKLRQQGIVPIIVHPERNAELLEHPERLQPFLEQGCLTQLTSSSYLGRFGKKIEKVTTSMIKAGQGAIFASDAHALSHREYELSEALQKLRGEFGAELADTYEQNARDIINGDQVNLDWRPLPKKKRFWFF